MIKRLWIIIKRNIENNLSRKLKVIEKLFQRNLIDHERLLKIFRVRRIASRKKKKKWIKINMLEYENTCIYRYHFFLSWFFYNLNEDYCIIILPLIFLTTKRKTKEKRKKKEKKKKEKKKELVSPNRYNIIKKNKKKTKKKHLRHHKHN
ncbi:hypothetical protein PUN28_017564 [Cardiocondyla obscurior]|uniref:Uncharacterized protein n=1 Tax=Cardiocondyla obscurior TaxID=286306 RepID=A0AAW2ELX8_9HYME